MCGLFFIILKFLIDKVWNFAGAKVTPKCGIFVDEMKSNQRYYSLAANAVSDITGGMNMPQPFHFAASLRLLLSQPAEDAAFSAYELPEEQKTLGMLLLLRLVDSAKEGNLSAFKELRGLLDSGEDRGEEVTLIDDIPPQ